MSTETPAEPGRRAFHDVRSATPNLHRLTSSFGIEDVECSCGWRDWDPETAQERDLDDHIDAILAEARQQGAREARDKWKAAAEANVARLAALEAALEQIAGSRHAADHHSAMIARAALATEGKPTAPEPHVHCECIKALADYEIKRLALATEGEPT